MSAPVFDTVRTIASDVLGVPPDQIAPDTSPATATNWDSVQHLNLVLAIEQAFSVMFEPEELDQMKSVGHIVAMVERKQRGPA
jgi:acyl carrier protein